METPKYTMPLAGDDSGAYTLMRDGREVGTILFYEDAMRVMAGLTNVATVDMATLERLAELRAELAERPTWDLVQARERDVREFQSRLIEVEERSKRRQGLLKAVIRRWRAMWKDMANESERVQLELGVAKLEAEHWKANHADMAARNALLSQRPDLPVDRIPAHAELARVQEQLQRCSGELNEAREELREAMQEAKEDDALRTKMAGFLRGVANALKGEPAALSSHSWHDLVEVAVTRMAELENVKRHHEGTVQDNTRMRVQLERATEVTTDLQGRLAAASMEAHTLQGELEKVRAKMTTAKFSLLAKPASDGHGMTDRKAMSIMIDRGMEKTGYVLQGEDGDGCIVHLGTARMLGGKELRAIVHPDQPEVE